MNFSFKNTQTQFFGFRVQQNRHFIPKKNPVTFASDRVNLRIVHEQLALRFPELDFEFVPLFQSSIAQFLFIQEFQNAILAGARCYDTIFVDLPDQLKKSLPSFLRSFPDPVALVPPANVVEHTFRAHGIPLEKQQESCPVLFFDPLEPRRQMLSGLMENDSSWVNKTFLLHGFGPCLQRKLSNYDRVSDELWLPEAFLTWFSVVLKQETQKQIQEDAFAMASSVLVEFELAVPENVEDLAEQQSQRLFEFCLQNEFSGSKILVLIDFFSMKSLSMALSKLCTKDTREGNLKNVVRLSSVRRKQEWTQKNSSNLSLVKMSDVSFADLWHLPSFVSHYLRKQGANSTTLLSKNPKRQKTQFEIFDDALQDILISCGRESTDFTDSSDTSKSTHFELDLSNFYRFTKKIVAFQKKAFPNLFDLVNAADATIDSKYAFELISRSRILVSSSLKVFFETVDFPMAEFFPHLQSLTVSNFERFQSQRLKKQHLKFLNSKKHTARADTDESSYSDPSWALEDTPGACSFPSEDIFLDEYIGALRKNIKEGIVAKETKMMPLTSSLGDGIAIRETLKSMIFDTIIIKEEGNTSSLDIGSLVFQFSHPHDDSVRFSWKSFWLAEPHDKSHLMFYATPYSQNIVGPGIAKSEFGGFASIPLATQIFAPWEEPFIKKHAQSQADALLLASALATHHRATIYFSPIPPSTHVTQILKQNQRSVVYQNLNTLDKGKVQLLRFFHVLADAGVRKFADKYIASDYKDYLK